METRVYEECVRCDSGTRLSSVLSEMGSEVAVRIGEQVWPGGC